VKLIIIGLLFSLYGNEKEFFFSLALLLPLRAFSGGMHMKTNIGCFIISLIFLMIPIKVLPTLSLNTAEYFFVFLVSIVAIIFFSPVASYKRPINTVSRRNALKRRTLYCISIESIALIVLWLFAIKDYFVIGVWVVVLHAIQLSATWAYRKLKGEIKNVGENQKVEVMAHGNNRS